MTKEESRSRSTSPDVPVGKNPKRRPGWDITEKFLNFSELETMIYFIHQEGEVLKWEK
jgi:hypothetical protein